MAELFSAISIRDVTLKNRIVMSPMCQYSATSGMAGDWHLVHYGSRAIGGVGLLIVEATAVEARGRITPGDLGLWDDEQIEPMSKLVGFIQAQGSKVGVQLAHAGRKASIDLPWRGERPLKTDEGGWPVVGPSPIPFGPGYPTPQVLDEGAIKGIVSSFAEAARRARRAGFDLIEIHAAHGYLVHQFLSPLSNRRTDRYGGSLEGRMRFALEVAEAVRNVIPDGMPLFFRISATDWVDGGWDLEQSLALARALKERGVDLIDCSSGGLVPDAKVPAKPGYQVPFASKIRKRADVMTGAVGIITEPLQAEGIVSSGDADVVILGRALLRNPHWPLHAATVLGEDVAWPPQYLRAKPK
ncbi:MAG TPA: NADH:flavin oxidoreductase/NADH oxidase [Thermosynergistes sp.]|nr:NADH:flavin oxidoreductase/NADH oxidase [Thermosynergistes sp.]